MIENPTTTKVRDALIEMFLDNTEGEVYHEGRLKTVREGSQLSLIAYHKHKLAEYDEATGDVVIHAGHIGQESQTVDKYISRVWKLAGQREGRNAIPTTLAENVRQRPVAESSRFIGQYVEFGRPMSDAERLAVDDVNTALLRAF